MNENDVAGDQELIEEVGRTKAALLSNLLLFTQTFYALRTGRDFVIARPICRRSHHIIIAEALNKVFKGESKKLIINVCPRSGKTELLMHYVAWTMAHNPQSNFLYVSVSYDLAVKATSQIKDIISSPYYAKMFGIELKEDSTSKGNFATKQGGTVIALGSGGTITGHGAGLRGTNKFSGCIIVDDIMRAQDSHSDVVRDGIKDWYYSTLISRRNDGEGTPQIFLGQRLHEDDLAAHLLTQKSWDRVILKSLDASGNALYPELYTAQELRKMQELEPYNFAAQQQQDPVAAGSGLYKEEYFPILETQPNILMTCIVCDTASSTKEWADYTAFGLFGIYEVKIFDKFTGQYGVHWLDCLEERIEPKDLESNFLEFYSRACSFGMIPKFCAIERKSTGETLVSSLSSMQGLNILPIERNAKSGSKSDRFIAVQSYIAQKLVTFPYGAKHNKKVIDHLCKINAQGTQKHDDVADILADILRLVNIDKSVLHYLGTDRGGAVRAKDIVRSQLRINNDRQNIWN